MSASPFPHRPKGRTLAMLRPGLGAPARRGRGGGPRGAAARLLHRGDDPQPRHPRRRGGAPGRGAARARRRCRPNSSPTASTRRSPTIRASARISAPTSPPCSTATRPPAGPSSRCCTSRASTRSRRTASPTGTGRQDRRDLALYLQSRSSEVFQTDIHPAARIGRGIFLDHATGLVVGSTAVIEDDVSILHAVTLGGTGKQGGDRHPKIRHGVMIGAGAKILGNIEVGACARVAAGSVVLRPVPPNTTVVGVPARVVGTAGCAEPARAMDQLVSHRPVHPHGRGHLSGGPGMPRHRGSRPACPSPGGVASGGQPGPGRRPAGSRGRRARWR